MVLSAPGNNSYDENCHLDLQHCHSMHVMCTLRSWTQTWSFALAVAASGSPSAAVRALDTGQCKLSFSRPLVSQLNHDSVLSTPCGVKPREWIHDDGYAHAGMIATVAQAQTQSGFEAVINTTSASVLAAQQHRQMPAGTLSQPQVDVAPALPTETAAGVSSTQPVATKGAAAQLKPRHLSEQHAAAPVQQERAVQPNLPSATVSAAASAELPAAPSSALAGGAQTEPSATSLPVTSVARPASPASTLSVPPSIAPLPANTTGVSSAAPSAASPAKTSVAPSPASAAAASAALKSNPSPTIALASVPTAAQMVTPVYQSAAAEATPAAAVTGQTQHSASAQAPHSSASSAAVAASGHADLPEVSQQMPKQMPVASDAHIVAQTATSADQPTVTDGGALPSAYVNLTGRLKPSVSMSMRPRSVAMGSKTKVPLKSGKLPIERPDLPFEPASLPFDQPLSAVQPSGAVASAGAVAGHALQQPLSASGTPQISLSSIPAVAAPTLVAAAAQSTGVAKQTSTLLLQNVPDAATAPKRRTEGMPALPMDRPEGSPAALLGRAEGGAAEPMGRPEGRASVPMGRADGSGAMSMGSRGMPGRQESRKGALPALSKARDDKPSSGVAASSTVIRTSSKGRDRHTSQDRHRDR